MADMKAYLQIEKLRIHLFLLRMNANCKIKFPKSNNQFTKNKIAQLLQKMEIWGLLHFKAK